MSSAERENIINGVLHEVCGGGFCCVPLKNGSACDAATRMHVIWNRVPLWSPFPPSPHPSTFQNYFTDNEWRQREVPTHVCDGQWDNCSLDILAPFIGGRSWHCKLLHSGKEKGRARWMRCELRDNPNQQRQKNTQKSWSASSTVVTYSW